ncbi:MAG: ornithine--oxo-acid transaminase [Alphaproteobacteria bacterium]|nr:ornithine--oxo-acid transaminase [Alphaproteobacteria bacterium]
MANTDTISTEQRLGAGNYKPLDVVLARGSGVWLWDVHGNQYLDCLAAYSAVNQGHCHPKIRETLVEQSAKLTLPSRAFRDDRLAAFYQDLCKLTNSHKVLVMNSGTEAVETAIKCARKWGYLVKGVPEDKAEIIVCDNNFHGRSIAIVGFSSSANSRADFGPFAPGFRSVPFGDATALEAAINPNTVAFLAEPIQGEGGVVIPPDGFLRRARELCDARNVLLVLDEVQTGLGRTGRILAEEHEGVEADITTVGKSLGGGFYPISAVLASEEVLSLLKPGQHGSTFGGNPLATAVARTALRVLREEGMVENAAEQGEYFLRELRGLRSNAVREVRGRGLMMAVELHSREGGATPWCESLRRHGVLAKETHGDVIRFSPPLVITRDEVDWALERIRRAFSEVD